MKLSTNESQASTILDQSEWTRLIQVHDKLKPFYCENCQFRSGTVSNLNIHRAKSHQSPKLSKKNLIEMVETGQHPHYTISDLPMIRRGPN